MRHGTQHNCGCLEDEERDCKELALLPGIVPILHDSLLNHMTIIIKVGASYVHHMMTHWKSTVFPADVTRLSSYPVFEERAWGRSYFETWSRDQGDLWTAKINESRTCGCNLTFDPLKIKQSRASEGDNQVIKHTFLQIPVANTSTQRRVNDYPLQTHLSHHTRRVSFLVQYTW